MDAVGTEECIARDLMAILEQQPDAALLSCSTDAVRAKMNCLVFLSSHPCREHVEQIWRQTRKKQEAGHAAKGVIWTA